MVKLAEECGYRQVIGSCEHTRCNNLIPGIVAAFRWGVESGKLVYSSMFGHIQICVYMSHRPNELFVPEQQRKQYVPVVYGSWKNY
jgi:hypothetical protein